MTLPKFSLISTENALSTSQSDVSWNTSSRPSVTKSLISRFPADFARVAPALVRTDLPNTTLSIVLPPKTLASPISTAHCNADFMLAFARIAPEGTDAFFFFYCLYISLMFPAVIP